METTHHTKTQDSIFWLGGVFNEEAMLSNQWISPAANRWMNGILGALSKVSEIRAFGHQYERTFPYGKLFPGRPHDLSREKFDNHLVRYCNIRGIRDKSLTACYKKHCFSEIARNGSPSCLLSYNAYAYNQAIGRSIDAELRVPWVPIILDFHDPGKDWCKYRRQTEGAAGHVFLSWWAYENCPIGPKLYLDGGIDAFKPSENKEPENGSFVFLYTGAVGRFKGVDTLIDAFQRLRCKRLRLWICGKAFYQDGFRSIQEKIENDERITYFGAVSETRLESLSRSASAFINPRPPGVIDHMMNFPSKLLEYLSYGKPVISTMTPGVSPEYRKLLIVPEGDGPEGLASCMEHVARMSHEDQEDLKGRIEGFMVSTRLWSVQSHRLIAWLKSDVLSNK